MKRIVTLATAILILSLAATISPNYIRTAHAPAYIDPVLGRASSSSSPSSSVQVIIALNHTPTASDANTIQQYSTMTAPMTQLPMVLAVTTYGNLASLASL